MWLHKEFKSLLRQLIVYHCRLVNLIVRGAGREGERKRPRVKVNKHSWSCPFSAFTQVLLEFDCLISYL